MESDWFIRDDMIFGNYVIKNTNNTKIILRKIWVHRNNNHFVKPYILFPRDSIVLEANEERMFSYTIKMMSEYGNYAVFFSYLNLKDRSSGKPHLNLIINYEIPNNSNLEGCGSILFLTLSHLNDYPDSLQKYIVNTGSLDFDSIGGTIQKRIQAEQEYLKQDSILLNDLNRLIVNLQKLNKKNELVKINQSQASWEKARYKNCENWGSNYPSAKQKILFYECAMMLTIERGKEIREYFENK